MRSVSIRLVDLIKSPITIGFVGENEHTQIQVDCKKVFDEYPTAIASLAVRSPGSLSPYPAVVERNGDVVIWTVRDSDLVHEGNGELQLSFVVDEVVVKSYVGRTKVLRSIMPTGEVPEPIEDWITQANEILGEIPQTIETAVDDALEEAKESGEFDGPPGDDGVSPVISVDDITGGHRITITDTEGTESFNVMDGENGRPGDPGQPGDDGYSPTISVTNITGGHRLTITDKNGTRTVDVMNGQDGSPGDPTQLIDDTAGASVTNRTFSASKLTAEFSDVKSALNDKYEKPSGGIPGTDLADSYIEEPSSDGTSGQVLTTDGNGGRSWTTPQSGGGNVTDVQIDGTSILNQGVANIPNMANNVSGVIQYKGGYGLQLIGNYLLVQGASDSEVKAGTAQRSPITPNKQDASTFYGFAKAAGDSTQSSSSNSVGTYTEDAKSKISDMLNAPVSVSGSTPSITAKSGVRYVCGECSTLTIVVPASGCIDVVFESGSTATVLTVTPPTGVTTVKWANGFDPTALDANTTYEVNILDGEYGVVGIWT